MCMNLRRYCTYKHTFCVEKYCLLVLVPKHRSALCKFRCGVAPIRIETGRYENLKVAMPVQYELRRLFHLMNIRTHRNSTKKTLFLGAYFNS